jgi:hypothetical protein
VAPKKKKKRGKAMKSKLDPLVFNKIDRSLAKPIGNKKKTEGTND